MARYQYHLETKETEQALCGPYISPNLLLLPLKEFMAVAEINRQSRKTCNICYRMAKDAIAGHAVFMRIRQ